MARCIYGSGLIRGDCHGHSGDQGGALRSHALFMDNSFWIIPPDALHRNGVVIEGLCEAHRTQRSLNVAISWPEQWVRQSELNASDTLGKVAKYFRVASLNTSR